MTAPEAPASSYTPFVTDLLRLLRAPFAPTSVLGEQRERPTFWMPWLLVSIAFGVTVFLSTPFQARAMRLAAEASGRALPPGAEKFAAIGALTSPVIILIMALIAAVALWVPLMATAAEVRFKGLMCVTIFSWPVAVIQQALNLVVLNIRGVESIQSATDAQPSFGLDLLLPADTEVSSFVRVLLMGIGPLQIWALCIVAFGLMALEKVEKGKAWTAAIVSYLVVLVASAGLASIFQGRAG